MKKLLFAILLLICSTAYATDPGTVLVIDTIDAVNGQSFPIVNARDVGGGASNRIPAAALDAFTGDVTTAGGSYATTCVAIQGKGITLATGYLKYTGSAWSFDNSTFLTSLSGAAILAGISGGQTLNGGTLTTNLLNLRANAADLTSGYVHFLDTTTASNATTGAVVMDGGLAVAKKIYSTDLQVTNKITGSISGNCDGTSGSTTGNAATVTVADEAADTTCYIGFYTAASGSLPGKTNTNLTFNASTGVLTAANTIVGSVNGNAGTCTTASAGDSPTDFFGAGSSAYVTGGTDVAVADGGTGTSTGSITGTGTLTFAAAGDSGGVTLTGSGATTNHEGGRVTFNTGVGGNNTGVGTQTAGVGGSLYATLGDGGTAPNATTSSTGGIGGGFTLLFGTGGASSAGAASIGGKGGGTQWTAGTGGAATGANTTNTGGNGGDLIMNAGTGGAASGATTNVGGTGGALTLRSGKGGVGASSGSGGGNLTIQAGASADVAGATHGGNTSIYSGAGTSTGSGSAAGTVTIAGANAGGDDTVNRLGGAITIFAGDSAGANTGGAVSITGGSGGPITPGDASVATGAVGGAVTIQAGPGGQGASANGAGGALNLEGGVSVGTAAGGAILFKVAATTTLAEAGRFDPASGDLYLTNHIGKYLNVSTVNAGVPSMRAYSALTGQTAAKTATTLYAVPAAGAGMYRVSWTATVTTAATTSCTLGGTAGFTLKYTDNNDSVVKTENPTTPIVSSINATGTSISGVSVAYCKASTNLQYLFGYTSSGATPMAYDLTIMVEYLG